MSNTLPVMSLPLRCAKIITYKQRGTNSQPRISQYYSVYLQFDIAKLFCTVGDFIKSIKLHKICMLTAWLNLPFNTVCNI